MDSDSWARISSAFSRRSQSRSEINHAEDYEREEEPIPEFLCPFCAEDYDMVGLCCHIDEEHAIEAKNGVCPVCMKKVGHDLVHHMTVQHGSLLKVQRKRRLRKGVYNLSSILRKELREGNLQSFVGGSSYSVSSTNTAPDPLLTSFIYNPPVVDDQPPSPRPIPLMDRPVSECSLDNWVDRITKFPPLSDEDLKEKARKCEFVQGLLMSTFLDDNL